MIASYVCRLYLCRVHHDVTKETDCDSVLLVERTYLGICRIPVLRNRQTLSGEIAYIEKQDNCCCPEYQMSYIEMLSVQIQIRFYVTCKYITFILSETIYLFKFARMCIVV